MVSHLSKLYIRCESGLLNQAETVGQKHYDLHTQNWLVYLYKDITVDRLLYIIIVYDSEKEKPRDKMAYDKQKVTSTDVWRFRSGWVRWLRCFAQRSDGCEFESHPLVKMA